MGCDRVINYKKEDFQTVMKKEYPQGVDIVFESVGGKFFDICLKRYGPFLFIESNHYVQCTVTVRPLVSP